MAIRVQKSSDKATLRLCGKVRKFLKVLNPKNKKNIQDSSNFESGTRHGSRRGSSRIGNDQKRATNEADLHPKQLQYSVDLGRFLFI